MSEGKQTYLFKAKSVSQ